MEAEASAVEPTPQNSSVARAGRVALSRAQLVVRQEAALETWKRAVARAGPRRLVAAVDSVARDHQALQGHPSLAAMVRATRACLMARTHLGDRQGAGTVEPLTTPPVPAAVVVLGSSAAVVVVAVMEARPSPEAEAGAGRGLHPQAQLSSIRPRGLG